jgi:hypothetical protein
VVLNGGSVGGPSMIDGAGGVIGCVSKQAQEGRNRRACSGAPEG